MNGMGNMQSFSTANGPPPGLTAPPGLQSPGMTNGVGSPVQGNMMNNGFGVGGVGAFGVTMKSPSSNGPNGVNGNNGNNSNSQWNHPNGQLPDYMLGR